MSGDDRQAHLWRALSASVNAYMRADGPALQATALYTMAQALEGVERGRDMIPALRLAQDLAPRDEAEALLEDAIGKYGFRIEEHVVENEGTDPRICATFNGNLIVADADYAPFVELPDSGLAVESDDRRICISGVEHGKRYSFTFREGLPSADGEVLAKDITVQSYIRDRSAQVSFPGRAYILPRAAESGLPVQTVNAARLNLKLHRISDRNLVAAFRDDYVARPLDYWSAEYFNSQYSEEVWTGEAETAQAEANRDVTTRLPMDAVLKDLGPRASTLWRLRCPDANPDVKRRPRCSGS